MFDDETIGTLTDQPLPIDVPSHTDTMKFALKRDPFDPRSGRIETQRKFWRFAHTVAL